MSSLDQAVQTQLNNIQKKTGKSLEATGRNRQDRAASANTARSVSMLMRSQGLSYGDANALVHAVLLSDGTTPG